MGAVYNFDLDMAARNVVTPLGTDEVVLLRNGEAVAANLDDVRRLLFGDLLDFSDIGESMYLGVI